MYYNVFVAYLLFFVGGVLGIHRFYLRKIPTGILWACSLGLGGLGLLYDFFTLPDQVRKANALLAAQGGLLRPGPVYIIQNGAAKPEAPAKKDSIEKIALGIAARHGGLVSPGEVALESDYTSDAARSALEKMAGKGLCEMRVRTSGVIVFRFPEFDRGEAGFEPGL
ncbi:MAG TPA: TM2 domain-containing protein [Spirochaetales bacterium]|nr:TM2 domain-containing protein [Spirochaetales bacterium]